MTWSSLHASWHYTLLPGPAAPRGWVASGWGSPVSWVSTSLPQLGPRGARTWPCGVGQAAGQAHPKCPILQFWASVGSQPPSLCSSSWLPGPTLASALHSQLCCLTKRLASPRWPQCCLQKLPLEGWAGWSCLCPWTWSPNPPCLPVVSWSSFHLQGPWPLNGQWAQPGPPLAAGSEPWAEALSTSAESPPCPLAHPQQAQQ